MSMIIKDPSDDGNPKIAQKEQEQVINVPKKPMKHVTLKQVKLAENIKAMATGTKSFKDKKELLIESGYSESTARTPQQVIANEKFISIMEELVSPEEAAKKVKAMFNVTRTTIERTINPRTNKVVALVEKESNMPGEELKALDLYFKLTGRYAPKKVMNVDPVDNVDPDKLEAELAKIKEEKKKRYDDAQRLGAGTEGEGAAVPAVTVPKKV